jgi:hypothetical protein
VIEADGKIVPTFAMGVTHMVGPGGVVVVFQQETFMIADGKISGANRPIGAYMIPIGIAQEFCKQLASSIGLEVTPKVSQ